MAAGKALVATEAAHEKEVAKDDATGGEQNTLSDTELDVMEFADARDALAARAAHRSGGGVAQRFLPLLYCYYFVCT